MKKRTWLALFALVGALCLCFGLAACDRHEHTFTDYVYNDDATCTENGTETAHCDHEGCSKTDTRTKAGTKLGHSMTYHPGTATCYAAGTLDYWSCSRCKKDFADEAGSAEMTVYESATPLDHTYTAENKCVNFETCGAVWEYTEGLEYKLDPNTDTYAVTGIGTASGDVVIPYGYQGKSVTSIGMNAFGCTEMTSITIPDSVTSIGFCALYGCSEITNITIPDSVTSIEAGAFTGTAYYNDASHWENGEALYIGNHLIAVKNTISGAYSIRQGTKTITGNAFFGCNGLTSITIPDSVISFGAAFQNCTGLKSIILPDSVTEIETNAFYGCSNLTSITIPDSVTSIGEYAFGSCEKLASITIPDSVTSIESGAFNSCYNLASITIPDSVTSIGKSAFANCEKLASIAIPDSVTSIGTHAFYNTAYYNDARHWENGEVLYNGTHLIEAKRTISGAYSVRQGTKTIADAAFSGCSGLTNITIPDSVTSIGAYAFEGCDGITNITVAAGNTIYKSEQNCLIEKDTNTLIVGCKNSKIPDSVTSIGTNAFSGCSGLTNITIPDSVTSIGSGAFEGCEKLADIQFAGTVQEWQAIPKGSGWDFFIPDYTVTCTDGTVDQDGNVAYFE